MEPECKGQDEEDDDDGQLEEGLEDVGDHEDVDAEEGEHLHVGQEDDPGCRDGEGADLPLPTVPKGPFTYDVRNHLPLVTVSLLH